MKKSHYELFFEIPGTNLVFVEEDKNSYEHLNKVVNDYQEDGMTKIRVYSDFTLQELDLINAYFSNENRKITKRVDGFVEIKNEQELYYTVLKY